MHQPFKGEKKVKSPEESKELKNKKEVNPNIENNTGSLFHSSVNEKEKKHGQKDSKDEFLSCDKCMYECKNENSLKKHKTLKHEEHKCKKCEKSLPTSFDLLLHVAKHHDETSVEKHGSGDKDEGNFKKD